MDELIGGLLALVVAVVVVSLLVAAAIAVFVLGAAVGALVGLVQGIVAFLEDFGHSVSTRGKDRRLPVLPEPAFQLYVLNQLRADLSAAMEHAWTEMVKFRDSCVRYADKYNSGVTTPLAWGVVAGGYIAPLIGAGLGLIVAAPILLVAGILLVGAWALVGVLRLAESVRAKVRGTAYECPVDHERFPLPVYICPGCGAEHHYLVPGRWGIFRRDCECGSVSLPTTVLGGRQRVPQRCPSGHPMSGLIGYAETLRIALVGGASVGKTTYLAAAMLEFERDAELKRLAVNVVEDSSEAYGEVVGALKAGRLPEKTQVSGNPALVTEVQGDKRSRVLYAYDVAGESYESSDEARNLRFLEVPSGLVLLVDPLAIRRVAEEHESELSQVRDAVLPSQEDPSRVLERTVAALIEGGAAPKDIPIAVVIAKTDVFGIGEEIEALRNGAGDAAPRAWLDQNGAGNFVRAVEAEFKQVRWFTCSALGRVPDPADRRPFEPDGATAPLLWLLERRGVAAAARPFEASRTAEKLAGADASSFPPIGGAGWAWRVVASSLAVIALLAVVMLAIAQIGSSASSENAAASGAPAAYVEEDGQADGVDSESSEESPAEAEYEPEQESSGETVNSSGLPNEPRDEMNSEIRQTLLGYHLALLAGRFQDAWQRLSQRKKLENLDESGYAKWRTAQGSLAPYLEPRGIQTHIEGFEEHGVARVDVSGMGWYEPGSSCSEWSGLTWAKYERGGWYYDPGYSTTQRREQIWKPRYDRLLGTNC
jgi:GTPase SAR1 family protein